MKKTSKIISLFLAVALAFASAVTAFAEEDKISVSLRIEGTDGCLLYQTYELSPDSTAADLIVYADGLDNALSVTGAADGYVLSVNDFYAGTYGGWDGWYYCVNNTAPDYGISDCVLADGDSVVLYYGAYPCLIPEIDVDYLSTIGVITFTAQQTDYDENWNPVVSTVALSDMTVNFDESVYTTDENGQISVSLADLVIGAHSIQVSKKDESGAPAVLRYADDFTVEVGERIKGDADGDGLVDINDVTYIQLYLAGSIDFNEVQIDNANIDSLSVLDINDATYIQKKLAGYTVLE